MSKSEKWDKCGDCKHHWKPEAAGENYPYGRCSLLKKVVADKSIHPDCPLPDWPSVSMEQVNALIYELATKTIYVEWGKDIYGKDTAKADLRIRPAQEIIAKFCDSISVEKEK